VGRNRGNDKEKREGADEVRLRDGEEGSSKKWREEKGKAKRLVMRERKKKGSDYDRSDGIRKERRDQNSQRW